MPVMLNLRQMLLPPGQRLILTQVIWQQFEAILEELGEHRTARLAYSEGALEIRMPLPEHETDKVILGDLVVILLEELEIDYVPLGSTTFKREDISQGIEPDDSFYIQNYAAMVGKRRLDLIESLGLKPRPFRTALQKIGDRRTVWLRRAITKLGAVGMGHRQTLNGRGGTIRLVRQHIPLKRQESPFLQVGEYVKTDPPPDLAIEVDVTSKTQLGIYRLLGVPELWRYQEGKLRIDILQAGSYIESQTSPNFPGLPLVQALPRFVELAISTRARIALKEFRQWVREQRP